jgi:putative ABC transport system permease protein
LTAQHVTESAVLAFTGTIVGVGMAVGVIATVQSMGLAIPRLDAVALDLPTLLFASLTLLVATLVTGAGPALRLGSIGQRLQTRTSAQTESGRTQRLLRVLCATQVAMSLVLVIGAGLLSRSLVHLLQTDLGVNTNRVETASLNFAFGSSLTGDETRALADRVVARLAAAPGVQAVGLGTSLPVGGSRIRLTLRRNTTDHFDYQAVAVASTPGYFQALGMRLVRGRWFSDLDDERHPAVMIMTVDTARRMFGEGDPIGRTMSLPLLEGGSREVMLVGTVANVKYARIEGIPEDAVYRPFAQQPWIAPFVVVRTSGDPNAFALSLQCEIASVSRDIVVSRVRPLDAAVGVRSPRHPFTQDWLGRSPASPSCWRASAFTVSYGIPSRGAPPNSAFAWRSAPPAGRCSALPSGTRCSS